MSMHEDPTDAGKQLPDEATLARLFQLVGKRDEPSSEATAEIRAAVHAEWEDLLNRREAQRQRRKFIGAIAAGVAVLAVGAGAWFAAPREMVVGRIARTSGTVDVTRRGEPVAGTGGSLELKVGDTVTTNAEGRAAIELDPGLSLRLDSDTAIVLSDADEIGIARGAVYVDAVAADGIPKPLTIATGYGDVRHVGTQYQVRLLENAIRVGIREGRIEVEAPNGFVHGEAGEVIELTREGNIARLPVAADAQDWAWAMAIAPEFTIENRPLSEFLAWAAREIGSEIVYASPAVQAGSLRVVLRGSVAGLTPDQAIDAVLATANLRADREPGRIVVRQLGER